jgi:hypothetical protein
MDTTQELAPAVASILEATAGRDHSEERVAADARSFPGAVRSPTRRPTAGCRSSRR